jgi:hypothetical protein
MRSLEKELKSPFFKGGFRGIIKALFIIPPGPPLEKEGNLGPGRFNPISATKS